MITTNLFRHKFIPAKKKSEALMIVLHGRGDSIRPFYSFNEELNIPEMNYLLLNAPRRFMRNFSVSWKRTASRSNLRTSSAGREPNA